MILQGLAIALLVVVCMGWGLHRRLVRPILLLTAAVRRMAEGDIDAPLPGTRRPRRDRRDDLGAGGVPPRHGGGTPPGL